MNIQRRNILLACLGAGGLAPLARAQPATDFETLFARALAAPDALQQVRLLREQPQVNGMKAVAPRGKRAERQVADEALRLIVLCEVTSEKMYTARYQKPVWPGGESGVTIGVGYDLGYSKPAWLKDDWDGLLDSATLARLREACGKTGQSARAQVPRMNDLAVPWPAAYRQFKERLLPLYVGATLNAVPLADALSDKSLGALVSLVYNRGPSFNGQSDRYLEMRAIKNALAEQDYARIPGLIGSMKRLWKKQQFPGLHIRRDLEAALFQEGLS